MAAEGMGAGLRRILDELADTSLRAHRLAEAIEERRWSMRPPQGGWSAAECLLHLNLTSERFAPVLERAVARARTQGLTGTGPFRLDVVGWLLCRFLEPPYRLRTRTSPAFVPDPDGASALKADVMSAFDAWQSRLSAIARDGEGLALDRVRVVSPFTAGVRYSVYSALRIIPVHQRRHLWQAGQAVSRV